MIKIIRYDYEQDNETIKHYDIIVNNRWNKMTEIYKQLSEEAKEEIKEQVKEVLKK